MKVTNSSLIPPTRKFTLEKSVINFHLENEVKYEINNNIAFIVTISIHIPDFLCQKCEARWVVNLQFRRRYQSLCFLLQMCCWCVYKRIKLVFLRYDILWNDQELFYVHCGIVKWNNLSLQVQWLIQLCMNESINFCNWLHTKGSVWRGITGT